jgi:antitoxin MazE
LATAILGKWGKNIAVRLPGEVVKAAGLRSGERVDVEARGGDIIIRKAYADTIADARAAAEEIIAESENYTLGDITIRELIDEGRRS